MDDGVKKYKLEDCPWCENDKNLYMRCEDWDLTEYYVECNYCDSRGPSVVGTEREAAEKWNDVMKLVRPIDPSGERDVKVRDDY